MSKRLTIYKYGMPNWQRGVDSIDVPPCTVLDLQFQNGVLCAWALHEVETKPSHRITYLIMGTGHEAPAEALKEYDYVKTMQDGPFVWHIFRVKGFEPVEAKAESDPFYLEDWHEVSTRAVPATGEGSSNG